MPLFFPILPSSRRALVTVERPEEIDVDVVAAALAVDRRQGQLLRLGREQLAEVLDDRGELRRRGGMAGPLADRCTLPRT